MLTERQNKIVQAESARLQRGARVTFDALIRALHIPELKCFLQQLVDVFNWFQLRHNLTYSKLERTQ